MAVFSYCLVAHWLRPQVGRYMPQEVYLSGGGCEAHQISPATWCRITASGPSQAFISLKQTAGHSTRRKVIHYGFTAAMAVAGHLSKFSSL